MAARDEARAGRGWRLLFVLVHLGFVVANVSALVSTARQRTQVEAVNWGVPPEQVMAVVSMDAWGTIGRLVLLAAGIYLTALIARGDERVPRYYLWYGAAFIGLAALLNLAQLQLWDAPRATRPAWYAPQTAVYVVALVGWVFFVSRSHMARAKFDRRPPPMGPLGRLVIGLLGVALITWPFILNVHAEATVAVAARISPKDGTPGMGFSEGILFVSVVTGLFVLMKNTFRMRNVWVAVLVPVSFGLLFLLYGMQGFMLHFRF